MLDKKYNVQTEETSTFCIWFDKSDRSRSERNPNTPSHFLNMCLQFHIPKRVIF